MDVKPHQHQAPHAWPAPPNGIRTTPDKVPTASQDDASLRGDVADEEASTTPSDVVATEPVKDEPGDRPSADELLPPTLSSQTQAALEAHRESAVRLSRALAMDSLPGIEAILRANRAAAHPLALAVGEGHLDKVKTILVERPQLLNAPLVGTSAALHLANGAGVTPLHMAIQAGHTDIALALLDHPDIDVAPLLPDGTTPLALAVQKNDVKVAERLFHKGADLHQRNPEGQTLLHIACTRGAVQILEWLLNGQGFSTPEALNQADNAGETPLHAAVAAHSEALAAHHPAAAAGLQAVVEALLRQPGLRPNAAQKTGLVPLHQAVLANNTACAQLLLAHPALKVNASPPPYQITPFYAAIDGQQLDMARLLLDHGADIDAPIKSGYTALHAACHKGELDTVQWLMAPTTTTQRRAGASPNPVTADGLTPLHLAVRAGHAQVVAHLLQTAKVDPNTTAAHGWGPLHDAIKAERLDVVEALLAAPQTDPALAGPNGITPLHLVAMSPHPLPLIKVFRRAMAQRDKLAATQQAAGGKPPIGRPVWIDTVPVARQIDSFKALTERTDRWGARPVSMAAQLGKGPDIIYELLPPAMARPRHLQPTTYQRGWLITGQALDTWSARDLADRGTRAGIDMKAYGDGGQGLSWEGLQRLDIRPGDFVICMFKTHWDQDLQRVMLHLREGEAAPQVDVARLFFEKGALKQLLLGCSLDLAADPLLNRWRSDPTIPRPADSDGGYEGLDITVVGQATETLTALNQDAAALFLADCGSQRTNPGSGVALETRSVQPMFTMGWDSAQRQLTVAQRAALTVATLDPHDVAAAHAASNRMV